VCVCECECESVCVCVCVAATSCRQDSSCNVGVSVEANTPSA